MTTLRTVQVRAGVLFVLVALLFVPLSGGVDVEAAAEEPPLRLVSPQSAPTSATAIPSLTAGEGEVFSATCNWQEKIGRYIHSRPSLTVGINDYGSIGINTPTGGTGFQMPSGQATENLAVGWWGEGWFVDWTGGPQSYHYPSDGPSGPITRIDDFYLDSSRYVTYRVTVDLADYEGVGPLLVDFEWTLDKETCDLTLRTVFENQATYPIDVYYKRIVDWDNLNAQGGGGGGFFWGDWNVNSRTASATRYDTATGNPVYECRTTALGTYPLTDIDLLAWDDRYSVGVGSLYANPSYSGDGNVGFHFDRNNLAPGGKWTTFLEYSCDIIAPCPIVIDDPVGDVKDLVGGIERPGDDA